MKITFGQALKKKLEACDMSPAELSRLSGVTKQNIGRLLNETRHPITNAEPKTTEETVEKIARAIDWDINDALLIAGFAPHENTIPAELKEIDFSAMPSEVIREIIDFAKFKAEQIKRSEPESALDELEENPLPSNIKNRARKT